VSLWRAQLLETKKPRNLTLFGGGDTTSCMIKNSSRPWCSPGER